MKNTSSSPQLKRSGQGQTTKTERRPTADTTTLSAWIHRSLSQTDTKIVYRMLGNILHILCEAPESPPMEATLQKLKTALDVTDLNTLPPEITGRVATSPIYQIFLYGRKQGNKQADWSVRIDPPTPVPETTPPPPPENALGIESTIAARQGNPAAIARYLSEILSPFGVGVRVQIRPLKTTGEQGSRGAGEQGSKGDATTTQKRLWVFCTSAYSPDPVLLVEPLAQRLRQLRLEGYRDALILGQVTGETKPEWLLRIDLTPPEQQLAAWARWGDIPALTRLLEQQITPLGLKVSGVIEESTLHLFFSKTSWSSTNDKGRRGDSETGRWGAGEQGSRGAAIDKETVKACIKPVLESIAPQGIIGATLYGQLAEESPPVWVDWLDLPASRHVELAATVLERAAAGDLEAITFLVDRQLNPDLDRKLQSGGMQVAIRRVSKSTDAQGDILHVLVDHPVSPPPRQVGLDLAKVIANLKIAGLAGVRIYGRVCGRVGPLWRHNLDFADEFDTAIKQRETVPEPAVEFPPTSVSSPDFLPQPPQTVLDREFSGTVSNSEDLQTFLTKQRVPSREKTTPDSSNWLRQLLIATHGFLPAKSVPTAETAGPAVTLVWGVLGLLGLVQADWFLASSVHPSSLAPSKLPQIEQVETIPQDEPPGTLGGTIHEEGAFDNSGFTATTADQTSEGQTAKRSDFSFSYPTFNSKQLDEQLANYFHYVAAGGPADVLIVGSSRALRGVDPATLTAALGTARPGLRIFNFGINGATAQVVEWLLRELLPPEYLPKLILWADGARAFNSGRADRTMEAIVASPGYKALQQGNLPTIPNPHPADGDDPMGQAKPKTTKGLNLAAVYEELDAFLASKLTSVSASYKHRTNLLKLLSSQIHRVRLTPPQPLPPPEAETEQGSSIFEEESQSEPQVSESTPQANGFLPISLKFDPYSYYDQYALVTGTYDADYQSFQLLGKQDDALQNILQFTQERDINLVFINTPLTMGYLDPVRLAYEREFQQYILALAMQWGFLFKDFSELWPTQNDYFSDPSHLNRFGADEVSRKLARDALISWPIVLKPNP
uniref:DUF1574 domain-containing protein n=1 Tax=Planktothricoides sp. SpSt-374 TaxID=2282167 RepID=A0A7C3ZUZ5_9CYAN